MILDLSTLDRGTLKAMYEREKAELEAMLLKGVSWNETKEQRKRVTELSSALHKRIAFFGQHPAESTSRKDG